MGMVVQHNMNALNAYNRLNANVTGLRKASEKLSSGYRINRAGDDAAGLAVSEKMRSQIKGLNQAIRNSQDGINMIQTFEGAAQETHSILQRMKELATESANGTYDNATDRAAMELEFKQLNDELDQIADTDFNGTIVLNGGQMSDGMYAIKDGALLKADKGDEYINGAEFDYKTGRDLMTAGGGTTAIDMTTSTAPSEDDAEAAHEILDNSQYSKTDADAIWDKLGITGKGVGNVDVTFVYDGTNWKAAAATNVKDEAGKALDMDLSKTVSKLTTTSKGNGGFTVDGTTLNAIFNAHDANEGDYITLSFQNKTASTYTPENSGIDEDFKTAAANITYDATNTFEFDDVKPTFTLDADYIKGGMTQEIKDVLDAVNDATVTTEWTDANTATVALDTATTTAGKIQLSAATMTKNAKGEFTVDVQDENGTKVGTLTIVNNGGSEVAGATDAKVAGTAVTDAADLAKITVAAGVADGDYTYISATLGWKNDAATAETITLNQFNGGTPGALQAGDTIVIEGGAPKASANTIGGVANGNLTLTGAAPADGTYIYDGTNWYNANDYVAAADIDVSAVGTVAANDTVTVGQVPTTTGKVDLGLNVDGYNFEEVKNLEAHAVTTSAAAKAAISGGSDELPLSISDAFENSTARLTYSNNIVLQTGARSKDAVRFTFKYNQDDSVDMRGLQANLNLSSRADGLNTKNLSLANQEDANYAIDQIDKAINKTSMVRATFGAIQNRLEHKITNLTTTSENLTEAESSIRDTDMASEMMNYTKYNILQQAAQSMLAQANQQPQSILQLLG